ncbi:MAG: hypothetical protein GKR88_17985 [Flavobacteriaceae bacterium]|nr:MAG: hypothetical protein GKR88_17985 [Flavobacteriaceae bacterium]
MKKIIFILTSVFITYSCKAQIIAVEDFENYNQELPDNAYIKDINNILDKYVGTWKGIYDSKSYEFKVIKVTENNTDLKYKEDLLLMRYKITDSSNNVIESTLNLSDTSNFIIRGNYLSNRGSYVLNYIGLNDECGQNGTIFISIYDTNNTKMKLYLEVDGEMGLDCTSGGVEQVLPTDWIDLTKQ